MWLIHWHPKTKRLCTVLWMIQERCRTNTCRFWQWTEAAGLSFLNCWAVAEFADMGTKSHLGHFTLPLPSDRQQVFAAKGSSAWARSRFQVSILEVAEMQWTSHRAAGSFWPGLPPRAPVVSLIWDKHRPLSCREALVRECGESPSRSSRRAAGRPSQQLYLEVLPANFLWRPWHHLFSHHVGPSLLQAAGKAQTSHGPSVPLPHRWAPSAYWAVWDDLKRSEEKCPKRGYLRSHPWGGGKLSRETLVRPGGCSTHQSRSSGGGRRWVAARCDTEPCRRGQVGSTGMSRGSLTRGQGESSPRCLSAWSRP